MDHQAVHSVNLWPLAVYMAAVFVIFDLESVFIFAWTVAVQEAGWGGYLATVVFIAILIHGVIHRGYVSPRASLTSSGLVKD